MSKWKTLILFAGIALIVIASGFTIIVAILTQSLLMFLLYPAVAALLLYFLHIRLHEKKETRFPIVPPEGRIDIYLPRTDIPRLLYEDSRKMENKKRRL